MHHSLVLWLEIAILVVMLLGVLVKVVVIPLKELIESRHGGVTMGQVAPGTLAATAAAPAVAVQAKPSKPRDWKTIFVIGGGIAIAAIIVAFFYFGILTVEMVWGWVHAIAQPLIAFLILAAVLLGIFGKVFKSKVAPKAAWSAVALLVAVIAFNSLYPHFRGGIKTPAIVDAVVDAYPHGAPTQTNYVPSAPKAPAVPQWDQLDPIPPFRATAPADTYTQWLHLRPEQIHTRTDGPVVIQCASTGEREPTEADAMEGDRCVGEGHYFQWMRFKSTTGSEAAFVVFSSTK